MTAFTGREMLSKEVAFGFQMSKSNNVKYVWITYRNTCMEKKKSHSLQRDLLFYLATAVKSDIPDQYSDPLTTTQFYIINQ